MSKQKQQVMRSLQRLGEGTPIDIVQHSSLRPDGGSVAILGINLAQAPVPDRRYVADVAMVNYADETIKVLFGQKKMAPEGMLRSLLVIHMSPRAARQFLRSIDQMATPTLDQIVEKVGTKKEKLELHIGTEPEQTVAFVSNIVAVAVAGREACLDFYHASSFAFANAVSSKKLPIDAVVRVDLRTGLFAAVVDELKKLEVKFPLEEEEGVTV